MRYQDMLILGGVILLTIFCLYAAVVGSDYNSTTTPLGRLSQFLGGEWETSVTPSVSGATAGRTMSKPAANASGGTPLPAFGVVRRPEQQAAKRVTPPPAAARQQPRAPRAAPKTPAKPRAEEDDEEPVF